MDLQTSLIDLDSIEQIEKNNFSIDPSEKSAEIEILAKTVISIKGLLRIPVVEQIGIESYKLISGHFDYYAYLRARELDSSLPDRIRVFIVNPKKEIAKGILEQLEAIDRIQPPIIDPDDSTLIILQQLSRTVNVEILERLKQVEEKVSLGASTSTDTISKQLENIQGIESQLIEIKEKIANATPVVTPPSMSDPKLGQHLINQLFANLAHGSVEVLIRKPQEAKQQIVQPIDLSSLTLEQVKEACLARSIVPMDLSELRELYSDLSIKGLNKKLKDYHIDLVVTSANRPAGVKKLLEYHESQANQSRQRSENSSSTKKNSPDI